MDNVCLNLSCLCGAQWLNWRFASSDVRVTVLCPRARHRNWYKTEGQEIVLIRQGWKILEQTDILPVAYYWIHQGRPIPTRPKGCWLRRKESSHASQNKQTNKSNAPTLPCQAQLSLIHVKSLQKCWATQPHQSTACSFWEFRKRHIDVPNTMLQYWMLIAGFRYLWCMGGSRKFCLGGWVSWKLYCSFFTEGSADLASFSKHLYPRGPTSSRGCQ